MTGLRIFTQIHILTSSAEKEQDLNWATNYPNVCLALDISYTFVYRMHPVFVFHSKISNKCINIRNLVTTQIATLNKRQKRHF